MKLNFLKLIICFLLSPAAVAQNLIDRPSISHDSNCFTQGLEIQNNIAWESCGGYGKSKIMQWDLNTHKVIQQLPIEPKLFAEGLTHLNGSLFLLTWKAGVALELDPTNLQVKRNHKYKGEGWGLTNDGKHLIMSNGSNTIQFINPLNFKVEKSIKVSIKGTPIANLNELEYINGKIWANIYQTDYIVIIDPKSGTIENNYHLPNLLKDNITKPGVLNGIAFDKVMNKIWVTGKNWPLLFEL
jgi:glutamine cyclotransferase